MYGEELTGDVSAVFCPGTTDGSRGGWSEFQGSNESYGQAEGRRRRARPAGGLSPALAQCGHTVDVQEISGPALAGRYNWDFQPQVSEAWPGLRHWRILCIFRERNFCSDSFFLMRLRHDRDS